MIDQMAICESGKPLYHHAARSSISRSPVCYYGRQGRGPSEKDSCQGLIRWTSEFQKVLSPQLPVFHGSLDDDSEHLLSRVPNAMKPSPEYNSIGVIHVGRSITRRTQSDACERLISISMVGMMSVLDLDMDLSTCGLRNGRELYSGSQQHHRKL